MIAPVAVGGRSRHVAALDGLRAAAALMVLVFHVAVESGDALREGFTGALLSRGDAAVGIFFVLSGLLLYRPWCEAALDGRPPPGAGRYLWRRALRVLPAYWAVVVVAIPLWSGTHAGDPGAWLRMLLLAQPYDSAPWWSGTGPMGLGQMWSLSVEAAFYLVLPLLAWGLSRFAGSGRPVAARARRLLAGLCALAAVSFGWTVLAYHPGFHPFMNLWLPRWPAFFACGMALAVLLAWAGREPAHRAVLLAGEVARSWGACLAVAALAYGVAASPLTGSRFFGAGTAWEGVFETALYALVAVALVAPLALGGGSPMAAFLGSPVMRFLGRVSYGIFLWQFVVIYAWYEFTGQRPWAGGLAGNLAAVTVLTVALATVSYHLIERPLRRWRR